MSKRKASDFSLMIATILLVAIGIIMVFSSSYPEAYYKMKDGYYFLKKQAISSILGIFVMIFFMNFGYWRLKKLSKIIFFISLVSALLIFTPLGIEVNGAKRWINLGITTFQPSEAVKLGSIIYLASFLSRKKEDIKSFKDGIIPALIVIGIACGIIVLQKDLSTSATLGIALFIVLFVAGAKILHLGLLMLLGVSGIGLAIYIEPYRWNRIIAFLNPFKYFDNIGWQIIQSLYALGSGGIFGAGLGKSRQKFFYIPEPYNDFIFAIIGEELGFIGCVTVVVLFLIVIWRGLRIALNINDLFGCLLAAGIVSLIAVQSIIHVAVVTSSMPPTGIPLPFISYGGTSILVFMAAVGILLNISRHTDLDRS
jgi:cell division protein FtsW